MLYAFYVGLAVFSSASADPAAAETGVNARELAPNMIEWISANSEILPYDRPDIEFVSAEWMAARVGQKGTMVTPEALYALGTHTLYLSNTWSPSDLRDQSILLHELVHHLQSKNEIPVSCVAQYNGLAYKLQIAWLREHEIPKPFDLLGIGPLDMFVQSLCPDPWGSLNDTWISSSSDD